MFLTLKDRTREYEIKNPEFSGFFISLKVLLIIKLPRRWNRRGFSRPTPSVVILNGAPPRRDAVKNLIFLDYSVAEPALERNEGLPQNDPARGGTGKLLLL